MRIQTIHVVAALMAAVAFVIAFIAAGTAVVSFVFALIGAGALTWLAYSVARRALSHRRHRGAPTSPPSL